jgi:redox-sensitive bicupin YhaK (pirin superfamily)
MTVVAGHAFGQRSPVKVLADTLYVSIDLEPGATLRIPAEHIERGLYPVSGELQLDGDTLPLNTLALLDPDSEPVLHATSAARVMLLGGEPLDGPRIVWWNFVSSSRERIERAKADWREGRFAAVPGETEFIPLPD